MYETVIKKFQSQFVHWIFYFLVQNNSCLFDLKKFLFCFFFFLNYSLDLLFLFPDTLHALSLVHVYLFFFFFFPYSFCTRLPTRLINITPAPTSFHAATRMCSTGKIECARVSYSTQWIHCAPYYTRIYTHDLIVNYVVRKRIFFFSFFLSWTFRERTTSSLSRRALDVPHG